MMCSTLGAMQGSGARTDVFRRTLVINLPEREDRRQETQRSLARYGINVRPGEVEFFEASRMDGLGKFPTRGAHGCFWSHLRAIKQARDEGWPSVCVMEDDVHPLPALQSAGPALLAELDGRPWDVALLGWLRPDKQAVVVDGEPRWKLLKEPFIGSHAYAVHHRAYDRLIGALERHGTGETPTGRGGRRLHYDEMIWVSAGEGAFELLAAQPVLFGQRSSRSDVVGEQPIYDRVPVLRSVAAAARRARNALRE